MIRREASVPTDAVAEGHEVRQLDPIRRFPELRREDR
jgi:hypothetical protein